MGYAHAGRDAQGVASNRTRPPQPGPIPGSTGSPNRRERKVAIVLSALVGAATGLAAFVAARFFARKGGAGDVDF